MIKTPLKIHVGGTLIRSGRLYLRRSEDTEFLNAILDNKEWTNIYGCRTMGKSSLYAQYRETFEEKGIKVIMVDLASSILEASDKNAPKSGYEWVCELSRAILTELELCGELELAPLKKLFNSILRELPENTTAGTALTSLIIKGLRKKIQKPILLILDEYDCIQKFRYCDELLFAFRHLQALQADSDKLTNFMVCFVG